MYRKDLFEQKGLTMPDQPTYEDVAKFAEVLNNKAAGFNGIALRGQPGWGENMATVDTIANTFGATWFDKDWHPTLDTPEWKTALSTYLKLLRNYGLSGGEKSKEPGPVDSGALGTSGVWRTQVDQAKVYSRASRLRKNSMAGVSTLSIDGCIIPT
jgi:sorbitol/mannitol transport system substrate-binding protein